jgi:hypothetical protein
LVLNEHGLDVPIDFLLFRHEYCRYVKQFVAIICHAQSGEEVEILAVMVGSVYSYCRNRVVIKGCL